MDTGKMADKWINVEHCPLCGIRSTTTPAGITVRADFEYEIAGSLAPAGIVVSYVQCARCGLMYQNPRMDVYALERFYSSGEYRKFVAAKRGGSNEVFDAKEREDARVLANGLPSGTKVTRHLDIGASRGYLLKETSELFHCETAAVEPNSDWLEFHPDYEFKSIEEVGGQFDLITAMHVLEHVSDPMFMLRNIYKLLTIDGTAIIEVPTGQAAMRLPHLYIFSTQTLWAASNAAGLNVERLDLTNNIRVYLKRMNEK